MVREHPSLAQFRERMKQGRIDRGWSQVDLANLLSNKGIGKVYGTTIAKIENRERTVRIDEAAAIAELFETSVDAMMGRNIGEDAEVDYVVRGITSSALRSAEEVRGIASALKQASEDLNALGDFAGRSVLQENIKRTLRRLDAAQGALATTAEFQRGMKAAPTPEEMGR